MSLTTYTGLLASIASWLNRDDMDDISPDFVRLAEGTLNKVIRSTHMVTNTTVMPSTYRVSVPDDMMEPIYLQVQSDTSAPLEQVSPEQLIELRRGRMRTAATPRSYAVIGRYFHFAPAPSGSTTINVAYYASLPPLSENATNWLLDKHPDLYLYTSLLHAAAWLRDDERIQLFAGFVSNQVSAAVRQNDLVAMDGIKIPGSFLRALTKSEDTNQTPRVAPGAVG